MEDKSYIQITGNEFIDITINIFIGLAIYDLIIKPFMPWNKKDEE